MPIHTNIIAAYLSGNISTEDQRALNDWLKESEANKEEFKKVKKLWELSQGFKKQSNYDADEAWNDFVELKNRSGAVKSRYTYHKIAAAIVLLVISAYVMKLTFFSGIPETDISVKNSMSLIALETEKVEEVVMFTLYAEDSVRLFTLPDNSRVYLNKNSTLQYPENFRINERTTYLTGEAFFEVTSDTIPFVVNCGGIKTKVLGTSFWLRAGKQDRVEVSVSSGSVEVTDNDHQHQKMVLRKNEKLNCSPEAPFFYKEISDGSEHQWTDKMSLGKKIKRFMHKLKKKMR